MFEDIMGNTKTSKASLKRINVDVKKFETAPFCPYCGSKDVSNEGGVFVPGKKFKANFKCSFCSNEWDVIFDKDTNVESIDAFN